MRVVLLLVGLALASPAWGKADAKKPDAKADAKSDAKADAKKPEPPPPPPRTPGPDDPKVKAVLDKIVAGPDTAARTAALAELDKLAGHTTEAIAEWLARPHQTDVAERRKILALIGAAVPDSKGTFSTPARQSAKDRKADDDLDWMKALLALDPTLPEPPAGSGSGSATGRGSASRAGSGSGAGSGSASPPPTPAGLGEVIGDVAAIRALANTKDMRAAQLVFDAAFGADTMIYRDECGRFIRRMEPFCIPALTRQAQRGDYDRRRYATFQLERLDRQDPLKALAVSSGNEALMIAVLEVFRETKLREAVHAVWTKVDDDSPRVRAAARTAWLAYITGPAPPLAPKKKLMLPGGKLTKKEKPLWLTYRELADTELRRNANELLHEDYSLEDDTQLDDKEVYRKIEKIDLQDVTRRLFEFFDSERTKKESGQWLAAKAKADAGDLATATTMLDRLIATNPDRAERADMARVYAEWGKQLEGKHAWPDAAAAFSKAHGLDPKGAAATERLAAHHFALGKTLESQGKDGGADFRRAGALKPDYAPAKATVAVGDPVGRPTWMLYAAGFALAVAAALFAMVMLKRRTA
jgi:hypothetical protein